MNLDPRLHAVRADLADVRLEGRVAAPRFAAGEPHAIAVPLAACRRNPDPAAPLDTEFLFGEPVSVFDRAGGWCWVQSGADFYVGYVEAAAVGPPAPPPTHRVAVPLALVFPEPSIKTPPTTRLPLGARLRAGPAEPVGGERFHALEGGGHVLAQHLAAADARGGDWVAVAEQFVGTPYLWGGKSWLGIDCSGLIQLAMEACGGTAPRDSDMQAAGLGDPLAEGTTGLTRGDLVFWRGHVGIMADEATLLHANGHHMATAREPLAEAQQRLSAMGLRPTAMRRLPASRLPQAARGAQSPRIPNVETS